MPRKRKDRTLSPDYWDRRLVSQYGLALRCQGCGKRCEAVFCRSCREDAVESIPRPDRSRNGRDINDDHHVNDGHDIMEQ